MNLNIILGAGLAACLASGAGAAIVSFDVDIENFGASDPDGVSSSPEVIFSQTFALGAVASIDLFSVELAHSFLSDVDMRLVAPNGDEFLFALGQSGGAFPDFNGGFDGGDLGNGGSLLAGASLYNFASAGDVWNDGLAGTAPAAGGTFAALTWQAGGWAAGDWTVTIIDAWDSLDDGALGSVSISYTEDIPAPGALALLGVAGLAGVRRRR
jgi:MYXO-CTERM domain-containing protein